MTQTTTNKEHALPHNRLSVQVALTGLSFFVSNSNTGRKEYFVEHPYSSLPTPEELLADIEGHLYDDKALQGPFDKVVVLYATDVYTLVPKTLFDESKASEYLKFNSKILANDFVAHDSLDAEDLVVVYVPYMNINNYMFDKFGSFEYYHSLSVLLKTWLPKEKYSEEPKAFIHVQAKSFDMVVLHKGQLVLANTFTFRTPQDFIYYILFSLEQLKLNPDTIPVEVCGLMRQDDDLYVILYRFVRNISFIESPILGFDETPKHFHFLLKHLS